jgi:regulator of nucleoside diphosphate kinase
MDDARTIFLSRSDVERLTRLIELHGAGRDAAAWAALEEEISGARVVEPAAVPPDVVTMNSRVSFDDVDTEERLEVTLVYPQDADVERDRVSVLAPVGSALLGLSVGQTIEWPVPGGKNRRLRVVAVTYQPEAAGRFDL